MFRFLLRARRCVFCSWRKGGAGACRTEPGDGDISTQRLMGCPSLPWACWLFVGVLGSELGRPLLFRTVGSFSPLRPRVSSNPLCPSVGVGRPSRRPTNGRPELRITWSALTGGRPLVVAICCSGGDAGAFSADRPFIPSQGSFVLSQGCVVRSISNDDSNAHWWGGRWCWEDPSSARLYVFARPYSLTLRAGAARRSYKTHLTRLRGCFHPPPPFLHPPNKLIHQHRTSLQFFRSQASATDIFSAAA